VDAVGLSWSSAHFTPQSCKPRSFFENLFKKMFGGTARREGSSRSHDDGEVPKFADGARRKALARRLIHGQELVTLATSSAHAAPLTMAGPAKIPVERYKNFGPLAREDEHRPPGWKESAPPAMG
jgi:hypothetical protein